MKNLMKHHLQAEELLQQDAELSDTELQQQRSRLIAAVELAERREKTMGRAALVSCVLLGLMVVLMSAFLVAFPATRMVGGVITGVLLIAAGVLLSLYNDKYRPAVSNKKEELQAAVLADLQRQVAELKKAQMNRS